MGIDDREPKPPLFEVGGHPVLDYQSIDGGDVVTFSFIVQIDEQPTSHNMTFSELMDSVNAWEVLKQKKWMDDNGCALVQLDQERECTVHGPGTYKLNFTYERKDVTYH